MPITSAPRRQWESARLSAAILAALCADAAHAQVAPGAIEEIFVTGSRIAKPNLVGAGPVAQLDAEELQWTGNTRVEDMLRNLPQVFTDQSSGISNGASGTATLDLRHLGAARSLVLVDGRRLPQGSPFTAGAADINQIPGALISRVEVLTGGASAIYGSDAVAGVVNFILKDDFDGVAIDYQRSGYAHDNNNRMMRSLLAKAGYETPGGTSRDGDMHDTSMLLGHELGDGRGNLSAYFTYREIDAVVQSDRDYSACALSYGGANFTQRVCGGSFTAADASIVVRDDLGRRLTGYHVDGDQFVPGPPPPYNFAPLNYYQRPDERYTAGAIGHFDLGEHTEAYAQLMYMDDETRAQIAPSGAFGEYMLTLGCSNPLLSAQQVAALCTRFGKGPQDSMNATVRRRNVEGGPRVDALEHESWRAMAGVRGRFSEAWRYDAYVQRAEVTLDETMQASLLNSRIRKGLDVVRDPGTGQPVCASVLDGSDPECVPWSIFGTGTVTPEALAYQQLPLTARGSTAQTVASAHVGGDLDTFGLRSPLATGAGEVVVGVEFRDDELEYDPDEHVVNNDVAGSGGSVGEGGSLDVTELFLELDVPLVEQRPWVDSLRLEAGYRYSDYSNGEKTDTWKLALAWEPSAALLLRASFQRAVRMPNIAELYTPQVVSETFAGEDDPCAGAAPVRSFEDCAHTGVTAEQYGSILEAPIDPIFNQYPFNQQTGGNPDLLPEEADTRSVGVVYTPGFLDGASLTVDWFDIELQDAIEAVPPETYLAECLDDGDPVLCSRIHRSTAADATAGTLWASGGFIDSIGENLSFFRVTGIDVTIDYQLEIGRYGSLSVSNLYNWLDRWEIEELPGESALDCARRWDGGCGIPTARERNYLRLEWESPWRLSLSLLWRHIGRVEQNFVDGPEDLESRDYLDLAGLWQVTERVQLRAGVNNLLDKSPPLQAEGLGNGNSFPGIYDALGQYWFAGFKVEFF